MAIIESHDYTLEQLFRDFYVVRAYQREYVWEEKHIRELLDDVYQQFSINKSGSDWEYFIGSIIVCESQGVYELIDGQQRMTTAYLILCAVRDYREKIKPEEPLDSLKAFIASSYVDQYGNERFRDRVELQYEDSRGVLEKIASKENIDEIHDTSSVNKIKNAYRFTIGFLKEKFGEDEVAVQEVKQFYACFIKNVKLVRVETKSRSHALTVFATINNRGVGLNAMDLLKNLMFIQVDGKHFDKLKRKWKEMVDLIFKAQEKPLRFLRYFIMASYNAERLREDKIYEWFEKNKKQCGYEEKPFDFVDTLVKSAQAFVNFKNGKDTSSKPNRYLLNISYLSTTQHLILLLAAQHLSVELFTELCKHIEDFLFVHIVTRVGTSKLENLFAQWGAKLRQVKDRTALEKFIEENVQPAKQKLSERFELAFRQLDESSVQKKIMQYILAKLTQYIDEEAYGSIGAHTDLKNYINPKVTMEHILSQTPTKTVKNSFDKPVEIDRYIQRLGNLTLLEKSINTSLKNKPFEEKKQGYINSKFLITKSIAQLITIGVNTAVDRAVKNLKPFDNWNSESIEKRQAILTELAKKVWNII